MHRDRRGFWRFLVFYGLTAFLGGVFGSWLDNHVINPAPNRTNERPVMAAVPTPTPTPVVIERRLLGRLPYGDGAVAYDLLVFSPEPNVHCYTSRIAEKYGCVYVP